jgi:mono/diheme cytochrome c family protein
MKARMLLPLLLLLPACQPALDRQPKRGALAASNFFADGGAARPLPHGVVPFLAKGTAAAPAAEGLPLLRRGHALYVIHCTACHGHDGAHGLAGERGFGNIPSLLAPPALRLTEAQVRRIILAGRGRMFAMGNRLTPADARAIAAFLPALQLSQHARLTDLPAEDRAHFEREER